MKTIVMSISILFLLAFNQTSEADWPQYLGPNRNAVSGEKGLLRSWPKDGPKVLWTVPLGEGFGGPAISEGKVYVYDRVDDETNILRCLDLNTGKEEWTIANNAPGSVSYDGSRSVPTIDGDMIYICDLFGNLTCVNKNSRKAVWSKNIWKGLGGSDFPKWAISQNPLIYKEMLIVAPQTPTTGLVAFDKQNGNIIWRTPELPGNVGYVSPALVKINGEEHLTMVTASSRDGSTKGAVIGYSPIDGKRLWVYEGFQCGIPVPNVTQVSDNQLFITGGYRAGGALFQIEKDGDSYTAKEILSSKKFGTHVHPAILYKGHLYGHCSNNEVRDGFVCMDLKGNIKWETGRNPGFDKGGFILADDMIISSDGEKMLYLIDPNPTEFRVLAKAELLETKQAWAPLALSDGKLVIRDQKQMKCVVVK
ncbi:MAG: PQQ-binding-like beta-propeller repeat protein [Desulfatiglans sp.]|jgi:outer membrane protein assembly factor BamB|nr:PQQ-binding-like beta-propeller repeat protein [Desulfatiglans sp.]